MNKGLYFEPALLLCLDDGVELLLEGVLQSLHSSLVLLAQVVHLPPVEK
jgi:hypothetical protein